MIDSDRWSQEAEKSARIVRDAEVSVLLRKMASTRVVRKTMSRDDISVWGELRNVGVTPVAIRLMAVLLAFSQHKQERLEELLRLRSLRDTERKREVVRELGYEENALVREWYREGLNLDLLLEAVGDGRPALKDAVISAFTVPPTATLVAAERKRLVMEELIRDFYMDSPTKPSKVDLLRVNQELDVPRP